MSADPFLNGLMDELHKDSAFWSGLTKQVAKVHGLGAASKVRSEGAKALRAARSRRAGGVRRYFTAAKQKMQARAQALEPLKG